MKERKRTFVIGYDGWSRVITTKFFKGSALELAKSYNSRKAYEV